MRGGLRRGAGRPKKQNKREDLTISIHPILKAWIKGKKSASSLIERMMLENLSKSGLRMEINKSGIPGKFDLGSILIRHRDSGWEDIVWPGPKYYQIGDIFDGEGYTKEDDYEVVCRLNAICECDVCQCADNLEELRYSFDDLGD